MTHLSTSTQKILQHARLADQGLMPRDPMKEAVGLELDMINILYVQFREVAYSEAQFVSHSIRLVQILSMQGRKK
jgi:growth hormone-inducible transmembrane protein